MIHDSHKYGAITELRCSAELIKRDWNVALPILQSSSVDLIAYRDKRFVKIQVKSSITIRHNVAIVSKDFSKYHDVDFIVCHDVYNRRWFIFEFEQIKDMKQIALSPRKYERNCDNWDLIR